MDNFEELRSAKPKRARAPKPDLPEALPETLVIPIEADIAAITLVEPPAPEPVELPEPTAAAPAETTKEEPIMATTAETVTETANATFGKGAQVFADMNDRAKGAMERGTKLFDEMNSFNKGNVEALVESGRIAAKGFERMGQDAADYARRQFEGAQGAFRQLAAVKSPTEFVRIQGELARAAFDQAVAETSRSTEAMLKLAGEVAQPISNRFAVVAERVKNVG